MRALIAILLLFVAQTGGAETRVFEISWGETKTIEIEQGGSVLLRFASPPTDIVTFRGGVLSFNPIRANELLVTALKGESVQVLFRRTNGEQLETVVDFVAVRTQPKQLTLLDRLKADPVLSKFDLKIEQLGENGALVEGEVEKVEDRALLEVALKNYKVDPLVLRVQAAPAKPSEQVLLEVRFLEVNRQAFRDLGFSYVRARENLPAAVSAGGPPVGGTFTAGQQTTPQNVVLTDAVNFFIFHPASGIGLFLKALESRAEARLLSSPRLVALPGQKANLLVGGEFPIPVVQGGILGGAVTIEFKKFGISLDFTPQILENGRIRLELEPEASSLDFGNGIRIGGFTVPALATRRAHTTIELGDGEEFAIGGLIDERTARNVTGLPGVVNIPILGTLFGSRRFQRQESELVVSVRAKRTTSADAEALAPKLGKVDFRPEKMPRFVKE